MPDASFSDSLDTKRNKRNLIFNYIYHKDTASKPELAAAFGISLPTIAQYIADLQADGLIMENGILDSTGGRKPVALSCNAKARGAIGLSLTPDHISAVILDLKGNRIASDIRYIPFSLTAAYRESLGKIIGDILVKASVSPDIILGVRISVPAVVSADGQSITYSHVFPEGLSCRDLCRDIPFSCSFCNDATAAGFAELWGSSSKNTAVYLSLSNTVGGAVIMDQKIYPGSNYRSGEFGHMSIDRDGIRCQCGQKGCLGCYCAATVLSSDYSNDLSLFFSALDRHDRHAETLWQDYLDHLASAVQILRSILDCDVIIGGFVGSYMDPYMEGLRQIVSSRSPFHEKASFVRSCRHKQYASNTGAALLLIMHFLETV